MKLYVLNQIKENVLVAVIRGDDDVDAVKISEQVIEAGIKTIELTFSTPYVKNSIEQLSKKYRKEKDVLIGAGTVLDDMTAVIAITSGADFIVSPHFDERISKVCNRHQVPYMPGCMSTTEVVKALENGADVVKLFPGGVLQSGYIKDLKGPIKGLQAMPSGGVSIENMEQWLDSGAYAIGIGSALTKNKKQGYHTVKEEALKFVEKLKEIKG